MPKKIVGGIDYSVNMINVMVDHDKSGAMRKWVDGIVKSWVVRILETIEEKNGDITGLDSLTEDARKLIIRAIMGILQPEERSIVFSTCLHHGIISMMLIPSSELEHVTIIRLD